MGCGRGCHYAKLNATDAIKLNQKREDKNI